MAEEWKPKIIGIICNWCSYAGADGVLVSGLSGCHFGD